MFLIFLFAGALLQVTVFQELNLLVVLSVVSGYRRGPAGGLLAGMVIGGFASIFSALPFRLNVALYGAVGLIAGVAKLHIYYRENMLVQFSFSFCGVILFYLLYIVFTNTTTISIFYPALVSACISPILFRCD